MEPRCGSNNGPSRKEMRMGTRITPLVATSCDSSTHNIVSTEVQQIVNTCLRRSTTSLDGKVKCAVSSDRLTQLRKIVETAIREHKTFTIKGGWQTLRNSFLRRSWVEKIENSNNKQKPASANPQASDDVTSNLPLKQDWESPTAYIDKCEKTIMSRLLVHHDVDFYWNMRKDQSEWHHRLSINKIMNRFNRALYTSKEGLALLLQQMYWHIEPGTASVNFPRCYVLGFPDHYSSFVDDFRITACISLLKCFVEMYQSSNENCIKSIEGRVPHTALHFAIDRCNEFLASKKHLDIDRDFIRIWDHEWDQFLSSYYLIVHKNELFIDSKDFCTTMLNASAKTTLKEIAKFWPDYNIDGVKNIWILKPGNKCRGRGIQLIKYLEDVTKIMNLKVKYVVQKYIERPLIIYKTKFDIRQWFLISSVQPLVIWMYRENYLRFSSQIFSLDNFHESLHLTNHAVQCKYTNVNQRDKALPDENMWDCHTFQAYLKQIGHMDKWQKVIVPGIREGIIAAMLASQETMDRRPNTFEIYGADFMIAEDFTPWLIEINSSPDLSPSTSVTARMCPQMLEDVVKVIVDKRRDAKADTGLFDLIYKQNFPRPPAYLGMNLSVRGRRIFKNRNKLNKKEKENEIKCRNKDIIKAEQTNTAVIMQNLPKILSPDIYKGPVIADLIEDLQHNFYRCGEHGVDFIPTTPVTPAKKKSDHGTKNDRVSKSSCTVSDKTKTNSVCRKQNVKENCRKKFNKKQFRLTREWSTSNKLFSSNICESQKTDLAWKRETDSILKSKHLHKHSGESNTNKTITTPQSLSSLSLYNILPRFNVNSSTNGA